MVHTGGPYNNSYWINFAFDLQQRVYSGVSAIIYFNIDNFRSIMCTDDSVYECRIVELYLTVDTTTKMQNGVDIDVSISSKYLQYTALLQR